MIVTLTGFMGCGKSTVGRVLAASRGWDFVDLDDEVTRREGRGIPEIFAEGGEPLFRKAELAALEALLERCSGEDLVLALGGGTLTTAAARERVLVETFCVYLRADIGTISARLGADTSSRPLFRNGTAGPGELLASREPVYRLAARTVETAGRTPEELASIINKLIDEVE